MKKNVFIFVAIVLLILATVPVINLVKLGYEGEKIHWRKSVLYNFDFILPVFNYCFYQFGISTDPKQVIIGKEDWLYLGDKYKETLTVTRQGTTNKDQATAKKIGTATKAWEQWLKNKGVQQFQIMLAPNKSTVYPEFLPNWMQPATNSATDTLLANVNTGLYIDTRPALKFAKSRFPMPLYYKTDTHWNAMGAWVAFYAFSTQVARTNTDLHWLTQQQVHLSKINTRQGGDLSGFLRMQKILPDSEVVVTINSATPIETERYNFETAQLIASGGNPPVDVQPKKPPILVKSKHALNDKKVLWLHDSFGTALAPFMAATFTETLQVHYLGINAAQFAKLVETYQPEYVFITTIERDILGEWFEKLPPI